MAGFTPKFSITSRTAGTVMRIEAAKEAVGDLPISAAVLAKLRETARINSAHYSTMIAGNRLTLEQVRKVVEERKARRRKKTGRVGAVSDARRPSTSSGS